MGMSSPQDEKPIRERQKKLKTSFILRVSLSLHYVLIRNEWKGYNLEIKYLNLKCFFSPPQKSGPGSTVVP